MTNLTHSFKFLSGDPCKQKAKWRSPAWVKAYWWIMDCLKIYHKWHKRNILPKKAFSPPGGINLSVEASCYTLLHSFTKLKGMEEPGCHMVYWRLCLINLAKQTVHSSSLCLCSVCKRVLAHACPPVDTAFCFFQTSGSKQWGLSSSYKDILVLYFLHHWLWVLEMIFCYHLIAIFMRQWRNKMENGT